MGNTEQFDRMAARYDTPERIAIAKITADAIRVLLQESKDKTAIDFGCGTGLVGLGLSDSFASILLLDSSQNMVDITAQKIREEGVSNARAVRLDFEAADHPELQTDYILMVHVLIHIREYRTVLKRLYERLNPEGHLLIADFDKNEQVQSDLVHPGFDQAELLRMLKGIGFQHITSRTFYSGKRLFMDSDASIFLLDARK